MDANGVALDVLALDRGLSAPAEPDGHALAEDDADLALLPPGHLYRDDLRLGGRGAEGVERGDLEARDGRCDRDREHQDDGDGAVGERVGVDEQGAQCHLGSLPPALPPRQRTPGRIIEA